MHLQPKSALPLWTLFGAALTLWSGCQTSTSYVLQVDAISPNGKVAQQAREPQSFKVRSRNAGADEDTLRYKEVSGYIKTALSAKGLYEAPSAETADLIVEIEYGMETPRMKYETVTKPVIGTRPSGTLMENINMMPRTPTPVRRVVDWQDETEPVIVYEKYLKVSARENREAVEGQPPPEVWSVNVSAEDQSNELRKYMPILASATADYIGTNTRQEKAVTVSESGDAVKFIKKGM